MAKCRKTNRNPDHGKGLLKRIADRPVNSAASQDGQPEKYVLMDFEVTWDVMPDPAVEALPKPTRDRMQKIFDLVHRKPKKCDSRIARYGRPAPQRSMLEELAHQRPARWHQG